MSCSTIAFASSIADTDPPLEELLDAHPDLRQAWERGELLRRLSAAAATTLTVTQAARHLGFERGADLRKLLDTDRIAGQLWKECRLDVTWKANRAIMAAIEKGDVAGPTLIRIEQLLRAILNEESPEPASASVERISQKTISQAAGVSRNTIYEWTHRGQDPLPQNTDGTFNLLTFLPWLVRWTEGKVLKAGKPTTVNPLAYEKSLELRRQRELEEGFLQDTREVVKGLLAREQAALDAERHAVEDLARELEGLTHPQRAERIAAAFNHIRELRRQLPSMINLPESAAASFGELMAALVPSEEEKER